MAWRIFSASSRKLYQPFPRIRSAYRFAPACTWHVEHRAKEVFGAVSMSLRASAVSPEGGVALSETVQQQVRNRIQRQRSSIVLTGALKISLIHRNLSRWTRHLWPSVQPTTIRRPASLTRNHDHDGSRASSVTRWVAGVAGDAVPGSWTSRCFDHRAIAVLPFANFSDDKANDYLANGIHESLLTICVHRQLESHLTTSVMALQGQKHFPASDREELGVSAVVEAACSARAIAYWCMCS